MKQENSEIQDILSALKEAPDDKKILIASKMGIVLGGMIKIIVSFDGMLNEYNKTIEPTIINQVKAIDSRGEKSVNVILDANSEISELIKKAPKEVSDSVQEQVNKIYQACNFQDLMSQHANEIRLVVDELTSDMNYFKQAFSKPNAIDVKTFEEHQDKKEKRSDSHLLNGPSTEI